ncbi:AAA family ATPase [Mitsuokella jalaludinii]|uniref:AAA family ATPase n=1 Tax=Mitsuokella jalaludinii TaxID=187979 RepID=UPI0005687EEE|nr:AAA family ATPase [Mitsuokella jalaludinii]
MRLQIKNFAAIREADIQFDGITVIAGENNAGKSTVGKILFSLFHGFYNMQEKIQSNRWEAIANKVSQNIDESMDITIQPGERLLNSARWRRRKAIRNRLIHSKEIDNAQDCFTVVEEYIKTDLKGQVVLSDDLRDAIQKDINAVYQYSNQQIQNTILTTDFNTVFTRQANSKRNTSPADLWLTIKNKPIRINIKDEICQDTSAEITILHSATYIDDPFVIDDFVDNHLITWRSIMADDLLEKMRYSKETDSLSNQMRKDKTEQITNSLHQVLAGEFVDTRDGLSFRQKGLLDDLSVGNLSAGLKAFAIIKRLLDSHNLNEQDVLILDEPEIHLHPEWQLIYAELIVLLQKTFNLTILLTTHSPYFLEAIEVFSEKHGLKEKTRYYLAHMQDGYATFDDVTDDTARIYHLLAEPFDKLDAVKNGKGWC